MMREVVRRLLGNRSGLQHLEEKAEPGNEHQAIAWQGCSQYLQGRTQVKDEQKPGRKPDMSEAAGAAFLDVLAECASETKGKAMDPGSPAGKTSSMAKEKS